MQTLMKWVVRGLIKPALSARVPVAAQRAWGGVTGLTLLGPKGASYRKTRVAAVPCMVIDTPDSDPSHTVLYLHGGAYVMGGFGSHRKIAAAIGAAAGARVYLPDYRLAPEHPHPAALKDALTVYSALLESRQAPGSISIAGDSAGGGLALALALAIRETGLPMPSSLTLLSPWVDMELGGDSIASHARRDPMLSPDWLRWAADAYCAATAKTDPACSPLYASLKGLPPTLIQVGSEEILLDDALRLHERAQADGVNCQLRKFEGMWHVFQLHYGVLKTATHAVDEIAEFMGERTAPAANTGSRPQAVSA